MKHNRTRSAIVKAFTELLEEQTIDKITVRMITDKVECSRKTFYYYFTDVYDLTRFLCDEKVKMYLQSVVDITTLREGFDRLMKFLDSERPVILNMFHGYGKEELERFTWQATEHYTRELIARNPAVRDLHKEDLEAVIRMYTFMLYGMMVDWIGKDMTADYRRTLDVALTALPGIVERLKQQ